MPLPDNFSSAEHLQDVLKRTYNGEVKEWFADITSDELDTVTSRGSLKTACTHQENDTINMTISRQLLFSLLINPPTSNNQGSDRELNYTVLRRTKPILKLFFLEDHSDVEPGYDPVEGVISFRLMKETTTTLSKSEATTYGNKLKTLFGSGSGFTWKKGKELASYTDWDKGYQLQLLVRTESEGKRIVEQVLDVQGHTPDWEFFNLITNSQPSQAFPTIPPKETILGKLQKLPRRRPICEVKFQSGFLKLAGLPKPVCLFDRSGRHREALVHR